MIRFLLIGILFLFISVSCTQGHGNKLESDQLDIYFEFREDEKLAAALGKFWKDQELIGEKKQTLRLTKDDRVYLLQLIANDPKEVSNMPFQELKLLLELQKQLNETVFEKSTCEIVLCNGSFQIIKNINEL